MLPLYRFLPACLIALCTFILPACRHRSVAPVSIIIDSLGADKNPYVNRDQSPMDMSYYPPNYPVQKMNHTDTSALIARVIYSRPHKKGRSIFGNTNSSLCQYGKEWRLGANEATEIEFFKNVSIAGKNVNSGTYTLYCIPYPDHWTIVFNDDLHTWGLHIDTTHDIFRTDIPVQTQSPALEDFTIVFKPAASGASLIMAWDNVKAMLPVAFGKQQVSLR